MIGQGERNHIWMKIVNQNVFLKINIQVVQNGLQESI
jgi:hypothetical protein